MTCVFLAQQSCQENFESTNVEEHAKLEVKLTVPVFSQHFPCVMRCMLINCFLFAVQACWVLNDFSEIQFTQEANLARAIEEVRVCLLHDKELPVKVEAALALQFFIKRQEKGEQYVHCASITIFCWRQHASGPFFLHRIQCVDEFSGFSLVGVPNV